VKGPIQQVAQLIEARVQLDNKDEIMDVLGTLCFLLPL
jgi:hypothetical protein